VFTLGGEQYALPIADVQEIIRYSEPRSAARPA
jgi:chemotaxis signal transduction protein